MNPIELAYFFVVSCPFFLFIICIALEENGETFFAYLIGSGDRSESTSFRYRPFAHNNHDRASDSGKDGENRKASMGAGRPIAATL